MPKDLQPKHHIALLDDDQVFLATLQRRLQQYGFQATAFHQAGDLLNCGKSFSHLVLDLNLGAESVLEYLQDCRAVWPDAKLVILTGYGSIATTVAALKRGADDYLTKPLNFKELLVALDSEAAVPESPEVSNHAMTPAQLEWEHIQQTLLRNDGNISATARELKLHRRTLQRKLLKRPVFNS